MSKDDNKFNENKNNKELKIDDTTINSIDSNQTNLQSNNINNNNFKGIVRLEPNENYLKLKNLSHQQILIKKLQCYGKLIKLVFKNYYNDEFELFRTSANYSLVFLTISQLTISSLFSNHPFAPNLKIICFIVPLGMIYLGYQNNIDILCSDLYSYKDYDYLLRNQIKDLKNEISLYTPFKKVYI